MMLHAISACFITSLVYIAVKGIAVAQPLRFARPEVDLNVVAHQSSFAAVSFAGGAVVLMNLLALGWLSRAWRRKGQAWLPGIVLMTGLTAQCVVAAWIVGRGIRQLSAEMYDVFPLPGTINFVSVAWIAIVAVWTAAWRRLAIAPIDEGPSSALRQPWFHESWLGSLSIAAVAVLWMVALIIAVYSVMLGFPQSNRQAFIYAIGSLCSEPVSLLALAAAIAGGAQAWIRLRRGHPEVPIMLPEVQPRQLLLFVVALLIILLMAAPIVGAIGVSFWFTSLPRLF